MLHPADPDLLAVNHIFVAPAYSRGLEAGGVGSRVGFGDTKTLAEMISQAKDIVSRFKYPHLNIKIPIGFEELGVISELTKEGVPPRIVDLIETNAIEQTRAIHLEGVPILFGTDVGYMLDADTTEEFQLLAEAGMDYKEILKSLTTAPAARYGFSKSSGKIEQQYDADLVFLDTDPRENVQAFADVIMTIRAGKVMYQR